MMFEDRRDAGRQLAKKLRPYTNHSDVFVLALPRGGVPVAYEVAKRLRVPLDVMIVRKLGVPGREELAMGAIASEGVRYINRAIVLSLNLHPETIELVAAQEQAELSRRERLYRGHRAPLELGGKAVILIDDGIATGATMHAAVMALRQRQLARLVVAAPTGSPDAVATLREYADEVVCLDTPEPYLAVGVWYRHFPQITDRQVRRLLAQAHSGAAEPTAT